MRYRIILLCSRCCDLSGDLSGYLDGQDLNSRLFRSFFVRSPLGYHRIQTLRAPCGRSHERHVCESGSIQSSWHFSVFARGSLLTLVAHHLKQKTSHIRTSNTFRRANSATTFRDEVNDNPSV